MKKIRIALISGGWSREREVSLMGGRCVFEALRREKYDVTMYDPPNDIHRIFKEAGETDLAFVLLHGKYGEDGRIQGLLEILGIPYVGSGVLSSAMAVNKRIAKAIYRSAGIPVAEDVVLRKGDSASIESIIERLGKKTVVKPLEEGSSLGMSVCEGERELAKGIETAFGYGDEVMVEEYVSGREVTCCVLGTDVLETLPLIEIIPDPKYRFFDYDAKYTPGATKEICPADIHGSDSKKLKDLAVKAHVALGCRVWSRTDMIFHEGRFVVLETNTIPGMTQGSLFPLAASRAGMSLPDLLEKLIALSLEGGR